MRAFWRRTHPERVRFVYLTASSAHASEVQKLAGSPLEFAGAAPTVVSGLELAVRTRSRLVLTDADLDRETWHDVVTACQAQRPEPVVLVILDAFDGSAWVNIIRARAYDVLLRPLSQVTLRGALAQAAGHVRKEWSKGVSSG